MDEISAFLELRSDATRKSYTAAANDFAASTGTSLLTATPETILTYLHVLKLRDVSDNTLKTRFNALRSMLSYLVDMGLIACDPMRKVGRLMHWRCENQRRPTKLVPYAAVPRIINDALIDSGTTIEERLTNAGLLAVLFGAALRRSEAQRLELADVMATPDGVPYLQIRETKAGRTQEQPLPDWAWERLWEVVALRRREVGRACENYRHAIFVARYGSKARPLSDSTIYRIFKRYVDPYCPGAAPHSARATAVTRLKAMGLDDRDVATFLRHRSINQVQVYDKRIRSVIDNPGRKLSYG